MQLPPLSVVEAWPAADPNASSRGQANLIVNLVLFPLALLFLILRIYTRLAISRSFGLDDVLILAAMVRLSSAIQPLGLGVENPEARNQRSMCAF